MPVLYYNLTAVVTAQACQAASKCLVGRHPYAAADGCVSGKTLKVSSSSLQYDIISSSVGSFEVKSPSENL